MELLRRIPLCAALLLSAAPAAGQVSGAPGLESVHVRVSLAPGSEAARVTARYALRAVADTLTLTAVPFFELDISEVDARVDGKAVTAARGSDAALVVRLPLGEEAAELELTWTVPGGAVAEGERVDVRVPLLLPRGVPVGSSDAFFRAELEAPEGMHVVESFPTVAGDGGATHSFSLPVAPGLLRWRLTTGAPPRVTFAGMVDAAVLALLVLLAALGVRGLRRTAREP